MTLRRNNNETRRSHSSSLSEMIKADEVGLDSRSLRHRAARLMLTLRDDSGQVMVLTLVCMAVLIGFVAFAVDVGMLLRAKRVMQTAADSAAIAGAQELGYGYTDYTPAAQVDASQNGVTNGANGATVTVNGPQQGGPQSGPFTGNTGNYVEVIVSQPQPTLLMSVFQALSGNTPQNTMMVSARAVAGPIPNPTGIQTLGSGPVGGVLGISMNNGANVSAPGVNIIDNAQGSDALTVQAGTSITAKTVGIVGTPDGSGTISPTPITGIPPANDPLSSLPPPAYPPCQSGPGPGGSFEMSGGSAQTFGPVGGGTICYNGLYITGGGAKTMLPGIYVINGPMVFNNAGGTVMGTGVTIYFPPGANAGSFSDNGGDTVQLSAPTSGTYNGVLFYQDPANTQPMSFTSDSTWSLSGTLYLPNAPLTITAGLSATTLNAFLLAGSVTFTGNAPFMLTPYIIPNITPPISIPTLVE